MINRTQEEIMKNWGVDNSDTPLVSVKCMTYNHEKYISQALDGFLMQKTNFPFEVLVHDDASTDKTADIIRKYEKKFPKIVKPIYETENQYSKGTHHTKINTMLRGKYIALCEGDDYWIDPLKLQKQIDFLETHPAYGMCYGKVRQYYEDEKKFSSVLFGSALSSYQKLIYGNNPIPTLTVCMRKEIYWSYRSDDSIKKQKWLMGDYPLWIKISHDSKIHFFDEVFGVYRILKNSASHSEDFSKRIAFQKSKTDISNYFCKVYNLPEIIWDENKALFDILYLDLMQMGYSKSLALKAKSVYPKIKAKNLRLKIIRFAISFKFLFSLYRNLYYFVRKV